MWKWYLLFITCYIAVGCGYVQPEIFEPHGIIQPTGGIRILRIDGERVISFSGDYVVRVSPGAKNILLGIGHNDKTVVDGTKSPFAKMVIEVEEGMCYYIEPEYRYGLNNLFFGAGFKEIKAWKPILKKQKNIAGYQKKNFSEKKSGSETSDEKSIP